PVDEHLAHEVFRRLLAARLVEREHPAQIEVAGRVEELEALLERGQESWRGLRSHDFGGVAVERDQRRLEAARVRELAYETQHRLMTEVHAVVGAVHDDRAS